MFLETPQGDESYWLDEFCSIFVVPEAAFQREDIGWGRNKAYFIKNFRVEFSVCGFSKAPSLLAGLLLCVICAAVFLF